MVNTDIFARSQESAERCMPQSPFTLDPVKFGLLSAQPILVHLTVYSAHLAKFNIRDTEFLLNVVGSCGTAEGCICDLRDWLLDGIASKVVVRDEADLLLVHPSSNGGVWVCNIHKTFDGWCCDALDTSSPPPISTNYALPENPEQPQDLMKAYRAFMNFAGPAFSRTRNRGGLRLLRVKVHFDEHWFLRFPLGVFAKFHLTGFENYSACQWIVTERTISAVAACQAATEKEMADTNAFLAGAHIVLNTYKAHEAAYGITTVNSGFDLLIELLGHFRNVCVRDRRLSLKWTLNPSPDQLYSILTSEYTRFVFADFEASGGIWTVGDGAHCCHGDGDHVLSSGLSESSFDLARVRGMLEHIRLMRIFHCNSIYDPYKLDSEPADSGTIATALLATDAFFVEGSVTAEPIIDFICTMLILLLGRSDLRTILFAQSLEKEFDISSLVARANTLLNKRGFPPI